MSTSSSNVRFGVATLLWLVTCIACFFGGRWSRQPEVKQQREHFEARLAVMEMHEEALAANVRSLRAALEKGAEP